MINLNGRNINEHPGIKYVVDEVDYLQALLAMQHRLKSEVEYIFKTIAKYNEDSTSKIGLFSLVRILMPVVDALSTVEGVEPEVLLERLNTLSAPNLTWSLYRDLLLHNDELGFGAVDDYGVPAMIIISGDSAPLPDILRDDPRHLDVWGQLYKGLVDYLDDAVQRASSKKETRQLIKGIKY